MVEQYLKRGKTIYNHTELGSMQRSPFDARKQDPLRSQFEFFGRKIAMHLERRDFTAVDAVVCEAKRFVFEKDNDTEDPMSLPVTAFIQDVRICNTLEEAGIATVQQLWDYPLRQLVCLRMISRGAVAVIRKCFLSINKEWPREPLPKTGPGGTFILDSGTTKKNLQAKIAKLSRALQGDALAQYEEQLDDLTEYVRRHGPLLYDELRLYFAKIDSATLQRMLRCGRFIRDPNSKRYRVRKRGEVDKK